MSFPLRARFAHPGNGWPQDQAAAAEHLILGEVYTIRHMDVGRSASWLTFCETPLDVQFNTVMFDADHGEPEPEATP